jgi:hypothetical protein
MPVAILFHAFLYHGSRFGKRRNI